MDQVVSDDARENERRKEIASALNSGVILVDADGQIVWMDDKTRRSVNGELQNLVLPLQKSDSIAIDCFLEATHLTINGQSSVVCVIQETKEANRDLLAAFESVLADTSSFTRNVIEKLRGLRQTAQRTIQSQDLEFLSEREREVLALICQGKSDIEMSGHLKLSENTVRNHIASLYRKIGVNRRSAAIIWARERGITADALGGKRRTRPPLGFREQER
ncbi:response regulator transcription factor [Bradyrhizobium sp. 139]|uniref:response regulator transcription factor n=1 Tax=Bradyrhizobium sp. 139 TaxID=2782616 RepID=UPI001FFC28C4|nr:LuxR C-terminal-related transcriptional regulator [Bradyrhizobium sp. 139]MCK1745821.1 response regulator transcription factor [Bradyrhizobium sp. 139]